MEDARKAWQTRADEAFLVDMPSRRRIVLEALLLLVLVFGEGSLASPIAAALVVAATLAFAIALVRPWSRAHGGLLGRAASTLVVVLAVVAPAMVEHPGLSGPTRRLGIGIEAAARLPGDPADTRGIVLVKSVEPGTPADGVLHVGDRIVAIGGAPLEAGDPVADLTRRTHGAELPEDTTVTVLVDGAPRDLPVRLPKVHAAHPGFGRGLVAVRDFSARHLVVAAAVRGALIIGLLLLLLRADGQPLAAVGIVRKGALRELLASTWMTAGAFGVQMAVAIPVAIVGQLTGVMNRELSQRTETLGVIAGQGSVAEFLVAVVVAAAFEEVAFRGFLTPRMRTLTGSWPLAIAVVSVVFGLGHFYEGTLAVVQTAFLGVYFSVLFLARRRLLGPTFAHAGFNAVVLILIRVVAETGSSTG
ncbi:MAG TPA: CPBP family glutamic-type intramembrane protease [Polyangiaceae bacterium]|jgi:membrane protease YdiL (CAAX protease family)